MVRSTFELRGIGRSPRFGTELALARNKIPNMIWVHGGLFGLLSVPYTRTVLRSQPYLSYTLRCCLAVACSSSSLLRMSKLYNNLNYRSISFYWKLCYM